MTVTPDYPDWTQPVASLEQLTVALDAVLVTSLPFDSGFIRCPDAQSLAVSFSDNSTSPAGGMWALSVEWQDDGVVTGVDNVTSWMNTAGPADNTLTIAHLPVRGTQFRVFVTSTAAGGSANLTVAKSTRLVSDAEVRGFESLQGRGLVRRTSTSLAAGATATYQVGPVARAVNLVFGPNAANCTVALQAVVVTASITQLITLYEFTSTAGVGFSVQLEIPGSALQLQLTNNSAVAFNVHAYMADVS